MSFHLYLKPPPRWFIIRDTKNIQDDFKFLLSLQNVIEVFLLKSFTNGDCFCHNFVDFPKRNKNNNRSLTLFLQLISTGSFSIFLTPSVSFLMTASWSSKSFLWIMALLSNSSGVEVGEAHPIR